jgi:hypothetical protein
MVELGKHYLARKWIESGTSWIGDSAGDVIESIDVVSFVKRTIGIFVTNINGDVKYGYNGMNPMPKEAMVHDVKTMDYLRGLLNAILDAAIAFKESSSDALDQ